jgi:Fe-S cluster biogenesis protein NfuA
LRFSISSVYDEGLPRQENFMANAATDLKQRVERALAEHVAPALAMDGTLLEVLDVQDGVARIRLSGVCGSCPSSIQAVITGIETELRKHVPEVDYVEATP